MVPVTAIPDDEKGMTEASIKGAEPTLELRPLSPFGCVVTSPGNGDLRSVAIDRLRELALRHRVVVLRGFNLLAEADLVEYCSAWGNLLRWNFGVVFNLREHQEPKNYLFTSGNVPYHWDGAFAEAVPSFQFFQCLDAPPADAGGETLFCDTIRVWDDAPETLKDTWSKTSIDYTTEKVAHYGGRITAPLVSNHPRLGCKTLRYAEPPNDQTARLNELTLDVHGVEPEQVGPFLSDLHARLYDARHCYAHAWNAGDVLIADNHALLHGRNAFRSGSPRHLQRVHIL